MDPLPSATLLARTLLALDRARASGELVIASGPLRAMVPLLRGTPRGIAVRPGDDGEALGDLLVRRGEVDGPMHRRALTLDAPDAPVGRWLVQMGIATGPAVAHALRTQMRQRMRRVFEWSGARCRFVPGAPASVEPLEEPIRTADLVLDGLRHVVSKRAPEGVRTALGNQTLRLTPTGRRLARDAALRPEEAALAEMLRAGAPAEQLVAAAGSGPQALRALWALKLIGAAAPPGPDAATYPLLLRKCRQLRRDASPDALLDLPAGAPPREARRALRRLAARLHPDRFDAETPSAVRDVSREVMTALVTAEQHVHGAAE